MRTVKLQLAGAVLVLALAVAAAYSDSFRGGFVLDDTSSIRTNDSILHLWPLTGPLNPPEGGVTVQGRPLVNLSFAINYALNGYEVFGYHLGNLLIHLAATLLLFGLVRRLTKSFPAGLMVALLWGLHPLQTEAVTYIVQRAESLMGLFYLLTLYGFVRSVAGDERDPRFWRAASVAACFLGMASKEVMVSAPVIVLLADRAFVAGSFRRAWSQRRAYYLALASSWLLLALLVWRSGSRGETSGIGSGVPATHYWITQPPAICRYLGLITWPTRLTFDYGTPWISQPLRSLPQDGFILLLVVLTIFALWKAPMLGFCGAWFFAILAPTSLVPGNRQVLAEHRLYLALAPFLLFFALLLVRQKLERHWAVWIGGAAAAAALGYGTFVRNRAYLTPVSLYGDTVAKAPGNPFNQANYGAALIYAGRYWEAEEHLRRALAILPHYPIAEDNLGSALNNMGRFDEAKEHFEKAIALDPKMGSAHQNLGFALLRDGHTDQAIAQIRLALGSEGGAAIGYDNLGSALASQGKLDEAIAAFRRSVALDEQSQTAHMNLGNALVAKGRLGEGVAELDRAIALGPKNGAARFNRATALLQERRLPEALSEFETAQALEPRNAMVDQGYGNALLQANRSDEAVAQLRRAVELAPARPALHCDLGHALLLDNQADAAVAELRTCLSLDPTYGPARQLLRKLGLASDPAAAAGPAAAPGQSPQP